MYNRDRLRQYFYDTYKDKGHWYVGGANKFISFSEEMKAGIFYSGRFTPPLQALGLDCGWDESYCHVSMRRGSGRDSVFHEKYRAITDEQLNNAIPFILEHPLQILSICYGRLTDTGIVNLFTRLKDHPCSRSLEKIELFRNNIGRGGVQYIIESLKNRHYPSLKYIDISHNQITADVIEYIQRQLPMIRQDIVIIYADQGEAKLGLHKNAKANKIYSLNLRPNGEHCDIAIQSSPISGVSAGDTPANCPPSVKEVLAACVAGATAGGTAGTVSCLGKGSMFAACVAEAALVGCAANVARIAVSQCMATASDPKSGGGRSDCNSRGDCESKGGNDCGSNTGCDSSHGDMSGRCTSKSYF